MVIVMKLKKLMKKVLKRVHKLMAVELKRYRKEDTALAKLDQENGVLKEYAPGPYEAIAYVDGSYKPEKGEGSYGIVLITHNDVKLYSKMVPPNEMVPKLSSTTELHAAATAMNIAASREIKRLVVKYDFVGIKEWALKPPKDNSKAFWYRDVYNTYSRKMQIVFEKVKAHNGVMHNEIADLLAKKASVNQLRG